MKIAIAADHAGLPLKPEIVEFVKNLGHEPVDLGAHSFDPDDDYPDFAALVAEAVQSGAADRGILGCGSGVGASVAANKYRGVRAAVCHDTYSAAQGVQHDDMNILCVGARVIGSATAQALVEAFLGASFDPHPRFQRRLDKLNAIEAANTANPVG
jgi:ribose 5-phosphate isomerase B